MLRFFEQIGEKMKKYLEHYYIYEEDKIIGQVFRNAGTPWMVDIVNPIMVEDLQSITDWCNNKDKINEEDIKP